MREGSRNVILLAGTELLLQDCMGEADGNMPVASLSPTVLWARPSAPFIKDPQLF